MIVAVLMASPPSSVPYGGPVDHLASLICSLFECMYSMMAFPLNDVFDYRKVQSIFDLEALSLPDSGQLP
jgi:hypothetical protein